MNTLAQARADRLRNAEAQKPWDELKTDAFPRTRQKLAFLLCISAVLVFGIRALVNNPSIFKDPTWWMAALAVSNFVTLAISAKRKKEALLRIVQAEAPELYQRLLIEKAV